MPEQLLFTKFLNHALAGPVTAMLRALHIEPKFPQAPIPNFVAMGVPVVPLGCALCAFVYYHAHGFRHAGIGYLKHFLGPSDSTIPMYIRIPLGALMLVIEPISHLARVMSLTIRLYGNMFAGDMVILVFLSLIPIGVPVLFVGLHIGVAFIQAYVFVLLTTVYLAGAVATDH